MITARPIPLLIAALAGEGDGVLTNWIIPAAAEAGFPVQSTSIPGVAQRTGATTYYIEALPVHVNELNGKRPVMALTPGGGDIDIDIAVASELLEAGRTVASGFVTPERTHVIASLSRFYAMDEKIAMGDGCLNQDTLIKAIKKHARDALLIDMEQLAKQNGSIISAVMLGTITGSGPLPLKPEQLEAAIRADGKAIDSNLRGFRAGFEAAQAKAQPAKLPDKKKRAAATLQSLEDEVTRTFPALVRPTVLEGVRRLSVYQSDDYAQTYLDRLMPIADANAGVQGKLLKEVARHLAVRMSYEDLVRVAQAKIAPARLQRIGEDELRVKDESFSVHDFLKPGIEELTQLLPPALAHPIRRYAERKGWYGRVYFGMEINTTSVSGYLGFLMLAKLRRLRPYGIRFKEEQTQIEAWLALIAKAAPRSSDLALEIAECARLIKGYGDTHVRGLANYRAIEARLIEPALAGRIAPERAADPVASARTLRWSIRKAMASPNASPRSRRNRRRVTRRNNARISCFQRATTRCAPCPQPVKPCAGPALSALPRSRTTPAEKSTTAPVFRRREADQGAESAWPIHRPEVGATS